MWEATQQWGMTGKPARVFSEFSYQTRKRKNGGWGAGAAGSGKS
jgi:hypothetical protein